MNISASLGAQNSLLVTPLRHLAEAIASFPAEYSNPPRAYIVGGFVRDILLGFQAKDADVEVYGVSAENLEKILHDLFPHQVIAVGKSFGVLKVIVDTSHHLEFDVALPRTESKTGSGHKGFAIDSDPSLSLEEASRRRDFTVNALAVDILTGEIFDCHAGLEDMKNKILRVVDQKTFQDDPLRVERGVQFAARLDFTIEPESFSLMQEMVSRGDLAELPLERHTEEFRKLLLKAERPSVGFVLMRDLGILEKQYPEIHALIDTPQELEWHPEGSVWNHALMVIDHAAAIIRRADLNFTEEERLVVMLGALCHDIGKPATTKFMDGRIRSLNHEEVGRGLVKEYLAQFTFGDYVTDAVAKITGDHLKLGVHFREYAEKKMYAEATLANIYRKILKRIFPVRPEVFAAVCESDFRGRSLPEVDTVEYAPGTLFFEIIQKYKLDEEPTKPLIGGSDIIELATELHLDIKPGPVFGDIIDEVEAMRDRGEVREREEALSELKKIVERFKNT